MKGKYGSGPGWFVLFVCLFLIFTLKSLPSQKVFKTFFKKIKSRSFVLHLEKNDELGTPEELLLSLPFTFFFFQEGRVQG